MLWLIWWKMASASRLPCSRPGRYQSAPYRHQTTSGLLCGIALACSPVVATRCIWSTTVFGIAGVSRTSSPRNTNPRIGAVRGALARIRWLPRLELRGTASQSAEMQFRFRCYRTPENTTPIHVKTHSPLRTEAGLTHLTARLRRLLRSLRRLDVDKSGLGDDEQPRALCPLRYRSGWSADPRSSGRGSTPGLRPSSPSP